jgi:hypothetical protein
MKNLKSKFKRIIPVLFFWIAFFIILFIAIFLSNIGAGKYIDFPGYIIFFLLFLYPFFFYIPFRLANLKKIFSKIFFIFFLLIVPLIAIYVYTYIGLLNSFGNINIL